MVLAREISKWHEEFLRGSVGGVINQLADQEVRGELTLVISGATGETAAGENLVLAEIRKLKSDGMRVKDIAALLGEKYSLAKREVYRMILQLENSKPDG